MKMSVKESGGIEKYVSSFPEETRKILIKLLKTIREAAPGSEEVICYRMPAFKYHGILVYFAAYNNHIGFYPTSSGIKAFQEELAGYKFSKGTIQFPINKSIPYKLVKEIVKFRVKENIEKVKAKKSKSARQYFKGLTGCITFSIILFFTISGSLVSKLDAQQDKFETPGIKENLPAFYLNLAEQQTYPLSWLKYKKGDFANWRKEARQKVMDCMFAPPPFPTFDTKVISEEDRGSYISRELVFNVTGNSRVAALMLIPKSTGPHPAVLLLHDHGGKFDIGKEKVIEPGEESPDKIESARNWVKAIYGGRFIGDELAKRGYVCFAVDMLNWSDRGGAGAIGQQALASNLMHLGSSFAGLIAWEDIRAAEFLSEQPEVDWDRIAAMGLSVGGFRAWQVAALSEHIAAAVSVCWMSTYKALMVPGNNQTKGQSAFTMLHPGLSNYLDYPDVASIACPKPMMFCCGIRDALFPVGATKEAFEKMQQVWNSQNAGDKLVTKLYDSPHEFNLEMQGDAFNWLDKIFKNNYPDPDR